MPEAKDIPLKNFHAANGARFVDFGGWNMPVQYTSILEEHTAVREAAGLFDVSHMGEFFVRGADAALFLDRLVVNAVASAADGKAVYSPMCAEDGTVVDDLIAYRIDAENFLVCVNASNIDKDFAWFEGKAAAWQLRVTLENQSDHFALLAIQGPKAEAIVTEIGIEGAADLKRFNHVEVEFQGKPIRICRTGYTGEDGFEIYVLPEAAESLAQAMMAAGATHGLKLCGLGARDSLRLEAGYPLYGHEISDSITPLEAGLQWTVKFKKPDFVGRAALEAQKEAGLPRNVVHFKLEGRRIAREGTAVVNEQGDAVGRVLSGTLSPMATTPIGSAIIDSTALESPLFVDLRNNKQALNIAKPPLHK